MNMPAGPLFLRGDSGRIPLPDRAVNLTLGSPPYCDARTYGIDARRGCSRGDRCDSHSERGRP